MPTTYHPSIDCDLKGIDKLPVNCNDEQIMKYWVLTFLLCLFLVFGAGASQENNAVRVKFSPGTSSAAFKNKIRGYEYVDYRLGAKAGQTMGVRLNTDNNANYFNIFAPAKLPGKDAALFIGSISGPRYHDKLLENGDYVIRVYLMRNAARRNEKANYTLEFSVNNE